MLERYISPKKEKDKKGLLS